MASYTMQLRVYIEMFSQYEDGLSIRDKIEIGRKKLFDFPYPFFDEEYRGVFETNFIRNFYMREIGFETEELFKFRLETWLNINMPYFNELFKSELIEYDPLTNAQMLTAHEQLNDKDRKDLRNINRKKGTDGLSEKVSNQDDVSNTVTNQKGTSETDTVDDNFSRNVISDNPDSRLQLQTQEGKGVIEYASDIEEIKANDKRNSKTTDSSNTNTDSTGNTKIDSSDKTHIDEESNQTDDYKSNVVDTEHYLQRRYGKIGADSYAKLIQEYRSALMRIEVQIHREMQELFMLVY